MSTSLQKVGKLPGRPLVAMSSAGRTLSRLLFLIDSNSGHRFLINTSAKVSCIPSSPVERKNKQECSGFRAAHRDFWHLGTRSLTLNLGLRCVFHWVFVVADIRTPIIGADFLKENGLMVSMKHGQLVDVTTNLQSQDTISHAVSLRPSLHLQQHSAECDTLLADFPAVTKPCLPPQPLKHKVTHQITITGPPVYARARHLLDRLCITCQEFKHMLDQEIIQPSNLCPYIWS